MAEFQCPVCGGPYPWRVWRSKNGQWCRHGERFATARDDNSEPASSVVSGRDVTAP